MTEEQLTEYIDENGSNFELYLLSDTVVMTEDNKYRNQETQHRVLFTKDELKTWYTKEYQIKKD